MLVEPAGADKCDECCDNYGRYQHQVTSRLGTR